MIPPISACPWKRKESTFWVRFFGVKDPAWVLPGAPRISNKLAYSDHGFDVVVITTMLCYCAVLIHCRNNDVEFVTSPFKSAMALTIVYNVSAKVYLVSAGNVRNASEFEKCA